MIEERITFSDSLRADGLALRAETDADFPFLERLYLSVRWPELELTSWTDAEKAGFLKSQFALQFRHYRAHYNGAEFAILERHGVPVGRLYLFRGDRDIRIVDVSLLPEARGRGAGTALLAAVLDEAAGAGKSASIHVEKFNPARRLYDRLGFVEAGENGPYLRMVRPAPAYTERAARAMYGGGAMIATMTAVRPALAAIAPLVGRQFALVDAAGNRSSVTLDQATAMPACEYPGRTRDPFQLQFRSAEHSVRSFLPQGTYLVEGLADGGIFLVPVGPPGDGASGFLYQAIFS